MQETSKQEFSNQESNRQDSSMQENGKTNDGIFGQRRVMKEAAHGVVRSHYLILTVFMLLMIFFGNEFSVTLSSSPEQMRVIREDGLSSGLVYGFFNRGGILSDILQGNLAAGEEKAAQLHQQIQDEGDLNQMFGRRNGVLAQVANGITSGEFLVTIAAPLRRLTGSDKAVGWIFLIGIGFWYILYYIFLKNVYSVFIRRLFLVSRIYKNASVADVRYFAYVKRWGKASLSMLCKSVLMFLWRLTIIGPVIKHYSYFCVDYIVAENPDIGPLEAVSLSRRMMYGHKLELFKYEVTLLGWTLLGVVTLGISEIAYGASYRLACYSEFYARIRQAAVEDELEGTQMLDDPYLFEKADRIALADAYFDVVDEITLLHEGRVQLTGIRKFLADWFGIWLGSTKSKKHFDDMEGRAHVIGRLKQSMTGEAYPDWLNPRWGKRELKKIGNYSPYRHYTIWTLFLLFIIFAMFGWTWEVLLHLVQTGQFANRGTLHGPWLPIYGYGGIIVLLLCNRFRKNPVAEFLVATALCGCLEYYISWYLEKTYHERWWSYDGYFLNLNGRICAEGLLVFGVGCCTVVYAAAPLFDYLLSKIRTKILIGACIVIGAVYAFDSVYSGKHPNMAEGAIEAAGSSGEHGDAGPAEAPGETEAAGAGGIPDPSEPAGT